MVTQTDILSALAADLTPVERESEPDYQHATHGTSERLFVPVVPMPGQLTMETDQ